MWKNHHKQPSTELYLYNMKERITHKQQTMKGYTNNSNKLFFPIRTMSIIMDLQLFPLSIRIWRACFNSNCENPCNPLSLHRPKTAINMALCDDHLYCNSNKNTQQEDYEQNHRKVSKQAGQISVIRIWVQAARLSNSQADR